ncbi:alpha-galactosidase [Microbacterium oleivorans]|uniref:Alpha-galactosidase n=2 Tax=Microbacterium oleivorans TaxID=273677 RepID=A0A4R5YMT1_9MICO|nr:alpha-galactosidase [Microbacterium oleivorans]
MAGARHALRPVPAVEVLTVAGGHAPASYRLSHSTTGRAQRHLDHTTSESEEGRTLTIHQQGNGVITILTLFRARSTPAVRAEVTVVNTGTDRVVLRAVPSLSLGFTSRFPSGDPLGDWSLTRGRSDWLGEGRWVTRPLRPDLLPALAEELTGHDPRGAVVASSSGTWSTGADLPVGLLTNGLEGLAVAWQIEHNGAWCWEVAEDTGGGRLVLAGPTDAHAGWTDILVPNAAFTSVPAVVAFGDSSAGAVRALTDHRRATRRPHPDNGGMPVVFNDYMNTLNGDPTTEKLLPLIAAAASVGAEVFCIDAGWYDDSGDWWDSVGAWEPSTTRFPGGLGKVIDAIRAAGMVPGLWLEPEVVGVSSPIAAALPAEAFLQRHGQRVVEHSRYHLDLRHPAATAHLDRVVDGLIERFGIGFFKFDYNIDPGAGTDRDAVSVGDGLLQHNRAHLRWLDRLLDRHPALVVENCASGAMRMDYALLSRLAMQSTSDQQDFAKYPPIAAAAPLSILPEQAASWAYPQPEMDAEEASFALVTGLLGRFYVSGHLNEMSAAQNARVAEAIAAAKVLRSEIAGSAPHWPLGLPRWEDAWVALSLRVPDGELVSLWRRGTEVAIELSFPHLVGRDVAVTTIFPTDLPEWETSWNSAAGTLTVRAGAAPLSARTLRLHVAPATSKH